MRFLSSLMILGTLLGAPPEAWSDEKAPVRPREPTVIATTESFRVAMSVGGVA